MALVSRKQAKYQAALDFLLSIPLSKAGTLRSHHSSPISTTERIDTSSSTEAPALIIHKGTSDPDGILSKVVGGRVQLMCPMVRILASCLPDSDTGKGEVFSVFSVIPFRSQTAPKRRDGGVYVAVDEYVLSVVLL